MPEVAGAGETQIMVKDFPSPARMACLSILGVILGCSGGGKNAAPEPPKSKVFTPIDSLLSAVLPVLLTDGNLKHSWPTWHADRYPKSEIILGIFDRFYLPRRLTGGDAGLDRLDSILVDLKRKGVPEDLVSRFSRNQDTTTRFEPALKLEHRCVFITDSLTRKPSFRIRNLPRKYVKAYREIEIGRPIPGEDGASLLIYMSVDSAGSIYYMVRTGTGWKIGTRSDFPDYYYISID
ncbi:MAG: hypothetical protein JWP91_1474 [Fibrobacteres bacterium]|nr:hypothetical protein [Fibrobacterota bacterium]